MISVARGLGILHHDTVPTLRALNAHHTGVVHLLIGPEGITDVVFLQHIHKVALPLLGVMSELTHIHRTTDGVAEVDVVRNGLLGGRTTIAMAGVHQLIVVAGIVEHPEEAVPMGSAKQDNMILIHLANHLHTAFVEWLEHVIKRILVLKIMGDGFVHQLIAEDGGLVLITIGNLAPYLTEKLLRGLTLIDPGIAVAVVNVIARLSSRTIVHIENQVQVVGLTPAHHRVNTLITVFLTNLSHIVFIGEELIVKGQTDGVGALLGNKVDIGLGHVVVLELLPELCCKVRTYSLFEQQVDHPGRVGTSESEHIAFRIQPVAQIGALNQ